MEGTPMSKTSIKSKPSAVTPSTPAAVPRPQRPVFEYPSNSLVGMPAEIKNKIYSLLMSKKLAFEVNPRDVLRDNPRITKDFDYAKNASGFAATCSGIYYELQPMLYAVISVRDDYLEHSFQRWESAARQLPGLQHLHINENWICKKDFQGFGRLFDLFAWLKTFSFPL
jgi:hypothetical protein